MKTFALIGHGRIGALVSAAWQAGELPGWELGGVLVRTLPPSPPPWLTTERSRLLAAVPDVVIEVGGPPALAEHAVAVLAVADLWTVSAAGLADAELTSRIERACRESGHHLRVLAGAIAGLDAVAMSAIDPAVTLSLDVELLPSAEPAAELFEGTVREAALRYPSSVNVAAAAALAGPGLDAARIRVSRPGPVERNRLALRADGRFGTVTAEVQPWVGPGVHPVAASVIAALRREQAAIRID